MTEDQLDRCPECGAFPKFGLRSHPKFAIILAIGHAEAGHVMVYAHSAAELRALWQAVGRPREANMQQWNGEAWETMAL